MNESMQRAENDGAGRIKLLNEVPPTSGRYVLYWMQAAQRAPATTRSSTGQRSRTGTGCRWS